MAMNNFPPADVLAMLEPGDVIGTRDNPTIAFADRTWFVRAFAGDRAKGVMVLSATEPDDSGTFVDMIADILLGAANLAVVNTDWAKVSVTPDELAQMLGSMLAQQIDNVHRQHTLRLANRKPS